MADGTDLSLFFVNIFPITFLVQEAYGIHFIMPITMQNPYISANIRPISTILVSGCREFSNGFEGNVLVYWFFIFANKEFTINTI